MAQSTTTIESVWAAKGNLPDNAIVATADGKYPALDGSLITNVGAGDLLAANNLSELTATASVARTNLELGAADTVEFGGFVPPSGTTAEIDAVTTATVGQVMVNSDSGQLVRFTGAAAYEAITSPSGLVDDSSSATPAITLPTSRFFEGGLVLAGDVFSTNNSVAIFTSDDFSDATGPSYVYGDGGVGVTGWVDGNSPFGGAITAPVVVPNKTYRLKRNDGTTQTTTSFRFNRFITSDITDKNLFSQSLSAGATYSIEITAQVGDLKKGNLRLDVGYTGAYTSAVSEFYAEDLITGYKIAYFNSPLAVSDNYLFSTSGKIGTDSPYLGLYTFKFTVTPSTSGTFTLSARQSASDVDGLMIGKVSTNVTSLT